MTWSLSLYLSSAAGKVCEAQASNNSSAGRSFDKISLFAVKLKLHYGFFTFDNFSFSAVSFHFAASNVAKNHALILLSYICNENVKNQDLIILLQIYHLIR